MTELDDTFDREYPEVVATLQERIRHGVEQETRADFVVDPDRDSYELPREAHEVIDVSGRVAATPTQFEQGEHFRVAGNRITWRPDAERPDPGSLLRVTYTHRSPPAGLTDFSPGSVIGTIVSAVARELTVLHDEVEEAYRRAFIDHANGVALDNVVALLGVQRIQATRASGEVTFARRRAGEDAVEIPEQTRVADESGRLFATTEPGEIPAGQTEGDVPVEAVEPGPDGNVNAETVVVMPTPPPGVDRVSNSDPISGGHEPEPDEQLRERAKHALERAGNATLTAVRNAVLGVEGVQGATVIDHGIEDSVPLGEVRVRHAGGDPDAVRAVVERTRAAGVLAHVQEIVEILVAGTFVLVPERDVPSDAAATFIGAVRETMGAKEIGEPLSVRRLNALAFGVDGLADVAEAQLTYRRGPDGQESDLPDTFLPDSAEQVRLDGDPRAVLLRGLHVATAGPADDDGHRIDLQLVDEAGIAVAFRRLALEVRAVFTATLRSAPDERVRHRSDLEAVFEEADTVTLAITEVPGFDPDEHEPRVDVELSARAHPGLRSATTSLDRRARPDEPE